MQGCRRLNSLLKNPEKQIPRRAKALLVMTKIKGLATARLNPRPFKASPTGAEARIPLAAVRHG
jgi:hypothetical protein